MDLSNVFSRWASQSAKDVWLEKEGRKLPPQLIWSQASCLATGLVGLGLSPAEGVAVWMRSVPEVVVAFLAVQLAGGCFVPVYSGWDENHLVNTVTQSGSSIAIISLELYDRYSELSDRLKSVRELVVDAGEASAETTLPSNARSLTPMLMVGRDVTLPDIEPHTRSMYIIPERGGSPIETARKEDRWSVALQAAQGAFKKGELIVNALDIIRPEAMLLGVIWPLLAGAKVVLEDAGGEQLAQLVNEKNPDTLIVDADGAGVVADHAPKAGISRVLWFGEKKDEEFERIGKLFDTPVKPLRAEVNSAGFLP